MAPPPKKVSSQLRVAGGDFCFIVESRSMVFRVEGEYVQQLNEWEWDILDKGNQYVGGGHSKTYGATVRSAFRAVEAVAQAQRRSRKALLKQQG